MTPKVIVPKWKDELSKTIRIYYSIYCLQTTMELFWNSWTCQWTKGDKNERNNSQPCPSRQIAHAKMKIHTLFTQPHIFPNDFSVEYQVDSLRDISCLMCGHIFWCSAKFCGWNPVISMGYIKISPRYCFRKLVTQICCIVQQKASWVYTSQHIHAFCAQSFARIYFILYFYIFVLKYMFYIYICIHIYPI